MFLSSTARLPVISWKRPLSAPYLIDWSCRSHSPPWSQIAVEHYKLALRWIQSHIRTAVERVVL